LLPLIPCDTTIEPLDGKTAAFAEFFEQVEDLR